MLPPSRIEKKGKTNMTQHNLPAVARHTGSTTLGRIGAGVGVNLTPWPPVERSPSAWSFAGAREVWQDEGGPVMFTETDAGPYAGARRVWQDEGGPVMYTETDRGPYAGARAGVNLTPWPPVERSPSAWAFAGGGDARTQAMMGAAYARKQKSQIYGMVLPPRGYAGRRAASRRGGSANTGMFPIGNGPGTVTLTADPGIGIANHGGGQSYVRILSRSGNMVTVRPTTYSPSGFSGATSVARRIKGRKFPVDQIHSKPRKGDKGRRRSRGKRAVSPIKPYAFAGSTVRPDFPAYPGNARLGIMGSTVRPDFPAYPGNARLGIMGGQYRPAFPSYPGRVGGQYRPAFPSYPGRVGYAGHAHDHGEACCESCANGGTCQGCNGDCGPDCGCKG